VARVSTTILHITTPEAHAAAQETGRLAAPSLETEGFIHCSTARQVVATADRIFRGQGDLLLLEIDPERLDAPLRYERATDVGDDFPHIYGTLNLDAVVATHTLTDGPSGYVLPQALVGPDAPE
jgi:uncharacterized protein (DUF952 family)